MDLLRLHEVQSRLGVIEQSYGGVRPIPVAQIIGSLARDTDFDREFRPRLSSSRERLANLRAAYPEGGWPAIEVYEVGGAFFVADGHHRVSLARERGAEFIDAEVTRLRTQYAIPADADVRELVHTEQQSIFLDQSGLGRARPDARIEFSRPGGYPELLEIVKSYGYDVAHRLGYLPTREEIAERWYEDVYLPGIAAVRAKDLPERYAYKTDADLFLWVYQRRRALRVTEAATDFVGAAEAASHEHVSRRFRREFTRETSRPLPSAR